MAREPTRRELYRALLKHARAWPRLRATEAYGHLLAQKGGCARPYGRVLPILVGGPGAVWGQQHELHLCVVVGGKLRGNQ
jgi:hypothetical protein